MTAEFLGYATVVLLWASLGSQKNRSTKIALLILALSAGILLYIYQCRSVWIALTAGLLPLSISIGHPRIRKCLKFSGILGALFLFAFLTKPLFFKNENPSEMEVVTAKTVA